MATDVSVDDVHTVERILKDFIRYYDIYQFEL